MAIRFVVVIKADRESAGFLWEVRELLSDTTGPVIERSGPVLISGSSPDITTAKHDAEVQAERLALEDAYIYNTSLSDPTPLPLP